MGTERNNAYLFNGKEFNDDMGLNWGVYPVSYGNYGARFYDPKIARWDSVDPLAEKYFSMSPYNYVGNNPIMRIDSDGRSVVGAYGIMNHTGAAENNISDEVGAAERARAAQNNPNIIIQIGSNYYLPQGDNPGGGGTQGVLNPWNIDNVSNSGTGTNSPNEASASNTGGVDIYDWSNLGLNTVNLFTYTAQTRHLTDMAKLDAMGPKFIKGVNSATKWTGRAGVGTSIASGALSIISYSLIENPTWGR